MARSELAVRLAELAESATPEILEQVLEMVRGCETCGKERDSHPQRDCAVWTPKGGLKDRLELLDRLKSFSLHEEKVADALGLNRKEVAEQIVWLKGVSVAEFKRLTPVEQDRKLLEAMGAAVIDVEPVKGPLP